MPSWPLPRWFVHDLLNWLGMLPEPLLYAAILLAAFAENVFPPLPADTVVALGAFVAARGTGTALGVWGATMIGNIVGAMLMYSLGKRYGMPWLTRKFPTVFSPTTTAQFVDRFHKHGLWAVVLSRFLPAIRAVVPPVAGAIGIHAIPAAIAMTLASGIWYGVVCWLAFRAGANADALLARIEDQQRIISIVVVTLVFVGIVWLVMRRRARASKAP